MSKSIDRYGVIGNPVSHSLSPQIHRQFAEQTGDTISYEAIPSPIDEFVDTVRCFRDQGGKGLNVTIPFKEEAWRFSRKLTPRAQDAGAVNTLSFGHEEGVFGDNTDGVGLLRDLECNLRRKLASMRILMLGAGGAARGITAPLLDQYPSVLVIANRNAARAQSLARYFSKRGPIKGIGLDSLGEEEPFDLIINATSISLNNASLALPDSLIGTQSTVYDLVYAAKPTPFMQWGDRNGAVCVSDGLGMLVEQAAESFFVWRGLRPQTRPVIQSLRSFLGNTYS
ncbi:shikimate dehydrogenase [Acidihalobacter prosperus]